VERLLTFSAIHSAIRDGYASMLNLSGPRYTILLCIRNLSDSGMVNIKTVADHLRFSGSYVSVETKSLVKMGLAYKELSPDDRRMISLGLTQKGTDLLDSIAAMRKKINSIEFGCLNKMEFRMLVPLVDRLVQSGERALALQNYLREHGMDDFEDDTLPA
jgi:DNA-binding MarR family transcriptional regulator